MEDVRNRRKQIMISKGFQIKLIMKFVLINALVVLVFSYGFYLFMNSEIDSNLRSAHAKYKSVSEMLFPVVLTLSAVNLIISSCIISFVILVASFRIAGPIFRFNQALQAVAGRNLQPLTKIREKDQFYECSENLGEAIRVIRDDIGLIRKSIEEIEKHPAYGTTDSDIRDSVETVKGRLDTFVI